MNDELLLNIATSLQAIAAAMASQSADDGLGFQRQEVAVVYCNPGSGKGWYTLGDADSQGERQQIHQPPTLKGYIKDLKFLDVARGGRDSAKLRVYLECGRAGLIILESGANSCFARSLLSSLAAVEDAIALQRPVTIFSYLNDNQDALFSSLTLEDGSKPKIPWTADSDWRDLSTRAKRAVYLATGREEEPVEPGQDGGRSQPTAGRSRPWGVSFSPPPISRPPQPVAPVVAVGDIPF